MPKHENSFEDMAYREDALLATLDSLIIAYGCKQEDENIRADLMPPSPIVRFKDKKCLQIEYREASDDKNESVYVLRDLAVSNIVPQRKNVVRTQVLRTFGTLIYEPKFMFRPNKPFSLEQFEPVNDKELLEIQQHVLRYGGEPYTPNFGERTVQNIGSLASRVFFKA